MTEHNTRAAAALLHTSICQAVALMNVSIGVASDIKAIEAHNILRQALMDYVEPTPAQENGSASEDIPEDHGCEYENGDGKCWKCTELARRAKPQGGAVSDTPYTQFAVIGGELAEFDVPDERARASDPPGAKCLRCNGSGEIRKIECTPGGSEIGVIEPCPACALPGADARLTGSEEYAVKGDTEK